MDTNSQWKIGTRYRFIGEVEAIRPEKLPPKVRKKRKAKLHLLLADIEDADGNFFRDHLWIPYTRKFKSLQLEHGDIITFWAKVYNYRRFKTHRGYGGRYTYRLEVEDVNKVQWQLGLKNIIDVQWIPTRDTVPEGDESNEST